MRRKIVNTLFLSSIVYILFTSSSGGRATVANAGNTGAPMESQLCGNCHNGGAFGSVTLSIQVFQPGTTTPVTAYVPGTAYDMRVTVQNSSGNPAGFGFQLTCLTTPGNQPIAGYSNLASNVKQKLVTVGTFSGRTYVEHNGVLNNNQFNFRWTAPAAGTGSVSFYSAGNAVNGGGTTGLDNSGSASLILPELQALATSGTSVNPTCFGSASGSINVSVSGGISPYSFLWSDGVQTEDRSNLLAGTYSVTITDQAGQQQVLDFTLTQNPPLIAGVNSTPATQPGSQGSISVITNGLNPPFTYTLGNLSGNFSTTTTSIPAPAGNYNLCLTDAAQCTSCVSLSITEPAPLLLNATLNGISCFGENDGTISIAPQGATPPYVVEWSNGSFENAITELTAGDYTVTITDATGYSITQEFSIDEPEALNIDIVQGDILCAGQTANVVISATGGTAPYAGTGSLLLPAGEQLIEVSDQNGCVATTAIMLSEPEALSAQIGSGVLPCIGGELVLEISASGGTAPYSGTGEVTITAPGSYEYTITDANGCSTEISTVIASETGFSVNGTVESNPCFGQCVGSINLEIINAVEPLVILWSDESWEINRTGLCEGTYTYLLTDAENCTFTGSFEISTPDSISIDMAFESLACNGDSTLVNASVAGGTSPYTLEWNNGETEHSIFATAGAWTLDVLDAAGCNSTSTVIVTEPEELVITVDEFIAGGLGAGTVEITVSGGTLPYNYQWSDGSTEEDVNLPLGQWFLNVTDNNGCIIESEIFIVLGSIGEMTLADISIFPNPSAGKVAVESGAQGIIEEVRIYSGSGNLVWRSQEYSSKVLLDLSHLPSGPYHLAALSGGQWSYGRISLQE
jgi:hypothetical protein